jgi:DNA modification methylase
MFLAPRAFIMKVQSIAVAELVNDPANVRRHSGRNLDAIKGSLARFGQQKPIVVGADGVVVAGNGTLEAAKALGWKKIDAVKTGLKGSDRTAFAIADNRTSELAEWDDAALAEQLSALAIDDEELLAAAGFDEAELEKLISETIGVEDIVEDEAPEPPADPVTKLGDLWQLGDHRVLCGDSTAGGPWDDLAVCIWTDPPYGVNHIGGTKDPRRKSHRSGGVVHNDNMTGDALVGLVSEAVSAVKAAPGCCLYMAAPPGAALFDMIRSFVSAGYQFKHSLAWIKHAFVFGRADYHYRHEMILYGWKKGESHSWHGDRRQDTVFEFDRGDKKVAHPTSKPVGLVAQMVANSTKGGQLVADPFLGSGTTLIAAEQLGRKCYGIEISPAYCDVIVERWQNLTGKKAKRVADGKAA